MNIINKVTWKAMCKNRTRTAASLAGIIISAAIFTAIVTLAVSLRGFLVQREEYMNGDYFVRFYYSSDEQLAELEKEKSVKSIAAYSALGFVNSAEKESNWSSFVLAEGNDSFFEAMPVHITEGRLPESGREIILPEQAVEVFSYYGKPCAVGEKITLEVTTVYEDPSKYMPKTEERNFSAEYTIVGVYENYGFNDSSFWLESILTYSGGEAGGALYHQLFVKTGSCYDAVPLSQKSYGAASDINYDLLNYYGVTKYSNYNNIIIGICAVLVIIVMVGTVSLIYNSFSISVSERTKEFGLLSSIGATKKQIRRSVYFEAFSLCGIGIPIGILGGYAGIAVTLGILSKRLALLLAPGDKDIIKIQAAVSLPAFALAAAITVVTVLISVFIPAIRSAKVTPLEAIRMEREYKTEGKNVKVSRLTQKLFGIHGVLASKYYRVSRKKYTSTIVSLTVSIVLFISATSLSGAIRESANSTIKKESFDFSVYLGGETDADTINEIKASPFVSEAVCYKTKAGSLLISEDMLSEDYRKAWEKMLEYYGDHTYYGNYGESCVWNTTIYYIEDSAFDAYIEENGLEIEENSALICPIIMTTPMFQNGKGEWISYRFRLNAIDGAKTLKLIERGIPYELSVLHEKSMWSNVSEGGKILYKAAPYATQDDGKAYVDESRAVYYEMVLEEREGKNTVAYYRYDFSAGVRVGEPISVFAESDYITEYSVGAYADELPFGIPSDAVGNTFSLIMPISALGETAEDCYWMPLKTDDYYGAKAYLDLTGITYNDHRASEENARTMLLMIDVFSYGFIVLISLISLANVINTISTNITLRKRDFAMIRSIGLTEKGIYRIVIYECLIYGSRALIFGVPIGVFMHFLIHKITNEAVMSAFSLPWQTLGIAVACIFAVVALSMVYAVSKMYGKNIADVLKNENL